MHTSTQRKRATEFLGLPDEIGDEDDVVVPQTRQLAAKWEHREKENEIGEDRRTGALAMVGLGRAFSRFPQLLTLKCVPQFSVRDGETG